MRGPIRIARENNSRKPQPDILTLIAALHQSAHRPTDGCPHPKRLVGVRRWYTRRAVRGRRAGRILASAMRLHFGCFGGAATPGRSHRQAPLLRGALPCLELGPYPHMAPTPAIAGPLRRPGICQIAASDCLAAALAPTVLRDAHPRPAPRLTHCRQLRFRRGVSALPSRYECYCRVPRCVQQLRCAP